MSAQADAWKRIMGEVLFRQHPVDPELIRQLEASQPGDPDHLHRCGGVVKLLADDIVMAMAGVADSSAMALKGGSDVHLRRNPTATTPKPNRMVHIQLCDVISAHAAAVKDGLAPTLDEILADTKKDG